MLWLLELVNQRLPSGPVTMPSGLSCGPGGTRKSVLAAKLAGRNNSTSWNTIRARSMLRCQYLISGGA